jgi:hypothetical protein
MADVPDDNVIRFSRTGRPTWKVSLTAASRTRVALASVEVTGQD